jgi:deoxycytidylate deaminase
MSIRIANKQADRSTYIYRLGAVITKGQRVLSTGYNQLAYCPLNKFKVSKHAEMDAILKLMRKPNGLSSLAGSTLYVSRLTKRGTGLARPCSKCWDLMLAVGISKVIYTTSTGTITEKV